MSDWFTLATDMQREILRAQKAQMDAAQTMLDAGKDVAKLQEAGVKAAAHRLLPRGRGEGRRGAPFLLEAMGEIVGDEVRIALLKPLPFRGGVWGGAYQSHRDRSLASPPHPNPSPEGEGL